MFEDTILLKIKRDFTESEAVAQVLKLLQEAELEIGILKSELAEEKYKATQEKRTKKEWLKDELIASFQKSASHDRMLYKDAMKSLSEWRNKYLSLIAINNEA